MSPAELAERLSHVFWADFWMIEAVPDHDMPGAVEWTRLRDEFLAAGEPIVEAGRKAKIRMAERAIESWVPHGAGGE